ncbi:type III-B CRISPR module RAMP protein Cmr4 [Desulfovibrio gilichinskyi]|uniref:CRISPR-associated protein, Cmr4 family n=1 Tax=Desulfovibrio gilichinskyi TaxID=1519643 RepID=A0A1X7D6H9_9BACT|nr:type III-B CRISPR module RAMP protein Cmr4 [Desulfovibrio gilichinskyi]SMF09846.1 CRISPR-associated protein, Cmr4 family [Desulfovibrio gilichinskyi]
MFTDSKILIYRAVTPLHCGATESGDGIDRPVVRERYTNFPFIPATSLKGVWRNICQRSKNNTCNEKWDDAEVTAAFGPDSEKADKNGAGLLGFVDAQVLYIPVRASARTFFIITCPLQLSRFNETLAKQEIKPFKITDIDDNTIKSSALAAINEVYLEDIKLKAESEELNLPSYGVPDYLKSRLALVSDETFEWFASNAMEIRAHNKLSKTKQSDNLWYEEFVPAESIFFGQLLESPPYKEDNSAIPGQYSAKIMKTKPQLFQVGGNESTGHGLMEITPIEKGESHGE